MKLTRTHDLKGRRTTYTLTIEDSEIVRMHLDRFDMRLITDCSTSNKISDVLLGLETIARRIEANK